MIDLVQQYRKRESQRPSPEDERDASSDEAQTLGLAQLEELVRNHPVAAISAGLVAGLALGWWVKRT